MLVWVPLALLLTSVSVSAQEPIAAARDEVIASIKKQAELHARYSDCMETWQVRKLFLDNKAGLTPEEVTDVYATEYFRIKKELDATRAGNGSEGWTPKAGWLVSILLVVWIVFQNVLKDWLSRFFNAAFHWVYDKLAGVPFFWGRALKRYQQTLHRRCAQLHLPPIRPNRSLEMRGTDVYVPLKVAGTPDSDQLEASSLVTRYRRSVILGAPGSGKSMLLKHLALSFTQDGAEGLPGRPVPVLLALHRFNDPSMKLEDLVVDELARNDFPRAHRFVSCALEKGGLVLLLDGLDEVNSSERTRVVRHLKSSLGRYDRCRVILTCRSATYRGELDDMVEQTLEIVGFNDQQIRRFLSSWAEDVNKPGRSIEQLIQTLHDRPRIMALARSPLLLTIIAYLYTDSAFVLPNSRTEFYRKSTDILLEDEWHKEFAHVAKATDKRLVLQHFALYIQDSAFREGKDRLSLERPEVLKQIREAFSKLNLPLESADAVLDEIVERSGLLLEVDGGESYQFAHLTLQEYFAATALKHDARGLLARFKADHDAWRETVSLWCGLEHDSTELIRAINEEDPLTAFECLADAQEVQPALVDELLETFKARLGKNGVDDAVVKAFGRVASDPRPRGEAVFNFLKQLVGTAREQTPRSAAANALSLTNLASAAQVLARHHAEQAEIRAALVRMGDLAVPTLKPLIESRPAEVMDDLLAIGTPVAARTLVPWLWHSQERLAMRAAWRMLSMLRKVGVEEVLRDYPLRPEQRDAGWLDWVWEPFHEPGYSALPVIAGRVAFLLARAPVELAPATPGAFDSRLVIPLCTVLRRHELVRKSDAADFRAALDLWELPPRPNTVELSFIVDGMLKHFNPTPAWRLLLGGVPVDVQAELLRRLDRGAPVTEQDWCTAFLPTRGSFDSTWWYYRAVFAIALVFSGVAMLRFLLWPAIITAWVLILAWVLLLGVGAALWAVGRERDRKVRNPLQNIIVLPAARPASNPRKGRSLRARTA